MKKTITFRDPVVENVVDKFVSRSDVGYEKYGRTLDTERRGKHKDLAGYLNDIQEELMDAILYIQAAREELAEAFVHGNVGWFQFLFESVNVVVTTHCK